MSKKNTRCNERIAIALMKTGMRQSELCRKTGIPKSAMSQYIKGTFEPKQDRIYKIAEALGVSEAWLMGFDVEMKKPEFHTEFHISDHEKELIISYRAHPEMQAAVDTLLMLSD